jgi:hypothetical protein
MEIGQNGVATCGCFDVGYDCPTRNVYMFLYGRCQQSAPRIGSSPPTLDKDCKARMSYYRSCDSAAATTVTLLLSLLNAFSPEVRSKLLACSPRYPIIIPHRLDINNLTDSVGVGFRLTVTPSCVTHLFDTPPLNKVSILCKATLLVTHRQ